MGNRSFVMVTTDRGTSCAAESNNNLPLAWFALLRQEDLNSFLQAWQSWEQSLPPEGEISDELLANAPLVDVSLEHALTNAQMHAHRPGVDRLGLVIQGIAAGDPRARVRMDLGQYRDFFDAFEDFRDHVTELFVEFQEGRDEPRDFDQVGQLYPPTGLNLPEPDPDPIGVTPYHEHRTSILDNDLFQWVLGIGAGLTALATFAFTSSVVLAIAVFLVITAGVVYVGSRAEKAQHDADSQ